MSKLTGLKKNEMYDTSPLKEHEKTNFIAKVCSITVKMVIFKFDL